MQTARRPTDHRQDGTRKSGGGTGWAACRNFPIGVFTNQRPPRCPGVIAVNFRSRPPSLRRCTPARRRKTGVPDSPAAISSSGPPISPQSDSWILRAWFASHAAGGSIGTSFGSIPYGATAAGNHLSEFRESMQNSRIGFRVDALITRRSRDWAIWKLTSWEESFRKTWP